ncbi:MAG: 50S ribosomal protein L29 [Bacillales bacterium]
MKIEEIKQMSTEDLNSKVYSLKEELYDLRRKKAVGQLEHLSQIKIVRKDIARIYTVLKERELGIK